MKRLIISAACAATVITASTPGLAQAPNAAIGEPPPPRALEIKPVKPGIYMVVGKGGNVVVVVGTDGVVLVDTKSPGQANFDELNAKISSITPLPVKEVIVTHHHPDHSGNIGLFEARGVPVAGQEAMVAALQNFTPSGGVKLAPPNVTFTDRLVIEAGGIKAEAYHFGAGHTGNDSIVYFPDQKVVAGGDQVEETPNIDYPFGGNIGDWLKSLAAIAKLDFDVLVPGHGAEPMTKVQFLVYEKNMETFAERGRAAVAAGVPKDKLLNSIKTDDLGWPITTPAWTAPARLDELYAELSQQSRN